MAILNVGGGDGAMQEQALRIDQNMALLALDPLAPFVNLEEAVNSESAKDSGHYRMIYPALSGGLRRASRRGHL